MTDTPPEDEESAADGLTFEQQMARFAAALQRKASASNVPLPDATNAFKALTTYYAILRRYPGKDDDDGDTTFDELQDDVRRVVAEESGPDGATPVRNRRR